METVFGSALASRLITAALIGLELGSWPCCVAMLQSKKAGALAREVPLTAGLGICARVHFDDNRAEGPTLQEGDHVYLFSRNLHSKRPSAKLDFKKYGPFRIAKKVATSNFELDLPTTIKVRTKVFHISLLELAPKKVPLEKEIEVEADKEEFDVEEILDSRYQRRALHYLVKWLDHGPESNS